MNQYKGLVVAILCIITMSAHAKKKTKKVVQKKVAPVVTIAAPAIPQASTQEAKNCPLVKVINNITPEMTTYPHWTKNYPADSFEVCVNGEPIKSGEKKDIALQDNALLKVTYKYSFANGYRADQKEETFTVSPDIAEPIALEFSWKNSPEHVSLKRITPDNGASKAKEVAQ